MPICQRHLYLFVLGLVLFVAAACGSDGGDAPAAAEEPAPVIEDDSAAASDNPDSSVDADAEAGSDSGQVSTDSGSGYTGSYTLMDDEFGTMVTVSVDGSTRTIETNALPDHETGEFPNDGNPNEISAQNLTWSFTTDPTFVGTSTEVRTPGVAVNGVKFEPGTAETVTCESGENYRIEALQDIYNLGLDFNNAHVQPTGEYHYHGISQLLVEAYENDDDLVLVGFAADGHLMYYSKSAAYQSSYELTSENRSGSDCLASGPNGTSFDIDGTTPDGTYASDWTYNEDAGDLDQCNGIDVDGQYVYIVTDTYPFVSRCLMGEVGGQAGG